MTSGRRAVAVVAILFALGPAVLEIGRGLFAGTRLAGWRSASEAIRPFDAAKATPDSGLATELARTRWPVLMLMCGVTLLWARPRWAVAAAWLYVVAAVISVAVRCVEMNLAFLLEPSQFLLPPDRLVARVSARLHFATTQAMDLLAPLLLLLAAKMRQGRREPDPAAVAPVEGETVLTYQQGGAVPDLYRWAMRVAFAVAAVCAARSIADLTSAAAYAITDTGDWYPAILPMYFFGEAPWQRPDAISEYLLRAASLMMAVGLWPAREKVVWSRFAVTAGMAMTVGWAVLETYAVGVSEHPMFVVAGHEAYSLLECLRVVGTELGAMAILAALLWRGPIAPDPA